MDAKLDILVPTHNHLDQTMRCIESLYNYTRAPFHLIVTDDSTDGLTPRYFKQLQKEHDNITYVRSLKQYKCGNEFINVGLSHCKTPYMVLVVNSMMVEPDWETAGLHLMEADHEVGVVGFKCLKHEGWIESAGLMITEDLSSLRDIGTGQAGHRLSRVYECMAVQFAFVLLRKEAATGNLREDIFHGFRGMEDLDNCFVIRGKGWKILYCGLGIGFHQTYATREARDEESLRQNLENREVFAKRWGFWASYQKIFPFLGEMLPDVKPREMRLPPNFQTGELQVKEYATK
ncbi:hypothetical protein LCGC14_0370370 [marine sediment metagenome]|uniref:Glycosyltransferase 2-like domain-containing protein n=1 Tax=marine sediment metagenome TaxID=412755 RepID=A0A0F9WE53_9ZZZZ